MPRIVNFEDFIEDFISEHKMENHSSVIKELEFKIKRTYDEPKMLEDTGVLVFSDLDCAVFRRGNLKEHQKLKYVSEYFRNLYVLRLFRRQTFLQKKVINNFFFLGGKEPPIKVKLDREFINICLDNHDTKPLFEYLKKMIFSNEKMQI